MLDDRNLGFLADALDQAFATTGNDDIDKLFECDQVAHGFAVCGLHQLHSILGQTAFNQSVLHELRQCFVGINCFRTTTQDTSIAAFNRQRCRFNRHIRTALKHHAKHTDRHAHLADTNTAGLLFHTDDVANDVGHIGELFAPLCACLHHLRREFETIDHGGL